MTTGTGGKRRPAWLEAAYEAKQQRSLGLVDAAIQRLLAAGKAVSLSSIISTSRDVDPDARGVSRNAILENERCRALYEKHRTWKERRSAKRIGRGHALTGKGLARLSKGELIQRIAVLENEKATLEHANTTLAAENLRLRLQARKRECEAHFIR